MSDVVIGKINIIQRCIERAREQNADSGLDFLLD